MVDKNKRNNKKIIIKNPEIVGRLQIGNGELTNKEVQKIMKRICLENPKMTVAEFLKKFNKKNMGLV